jgi:hypothetical protein
VQGTDSFRTSKGWRAAWRERRVEEGEKEEEEESLKIQRTNFNNS